MPPLVNLNQGLGSMLLNIRGAGFVLIFITLLLPCGCLLSTGGQEAKGLLIESNKRQIPAWAAYPRGQLRAEGSGFRFVYQRKGLHDLQLGIVQTERLAKEACLRALNSKMTDSGNGNTGSKLRSRRPELTISDIYYEGSEEGGAGGPAIWDVRILVRVSFSGRK